MGRRRLFWHIGLSDPARPVIGASLEAHHEALDEAGVRLVATPDEVRSATHELLRTRHHAGLSRREVEGRWARICDRVWSHKGISVLSTPDLCVADKDQIRLALDPLIGIEVHLVVTVESISQQLYGGWLAELRAGRSTGWEKYVDRVLAAVPQERQAERFWAGHDVPAVVNRWGWTLHADRVHVIAARDVADHWHAFLEGAGIAGDGMPAVVPPYADPAGVAVLRSVNRQVADPLRRETVRLLAAPAPEASAMPTAPTAPLGSRMHEWTHGLVAAGHDVQGDLTQLLDEGAPGSGARRRDQLAVAVDALAEALTDNSRLRTDLAALEQDRDRLARKRRKLKRRLKQAGPN
jgi:hypothetical protein